MKINIVKKGLIAFSSLLLFGTSCSDGFLDSTSSDVVGGSEIPESKKEETAKQFMEGLYYSTFNSNYQVSHDDFSIRALMLASDLMTEDMAMFGRSQFIFDYENDFRLLTYRRTKSTWLQNYNMISTANDVIKLIKSLGDEANLSVNQKCLLAQAYGVRGYLYFMLINFYQQPYAIAKDKPGIPIMTDEVTKAGRNTVAEVYELLLSDLNKSYSLLKDSGLKDPNALNEFSVAGMLARAYCFVNDEPNQWQKVADFAYIATKGSNPATKEQLISKFHTLDQVDALWGAKIDSETNTYYASFMSNIDPYSNAYGTAAPKMIFNKLYDQMDANDIRKAWFSETPLKVLKKDNTEVTLPALTQLKFQDRGSFTSDYIFMRASEFYFVAAEAYMKLNNEGKARQYLEDVMKIRIPNYSASSKSGDALLKEIQFQKRIETWGEGVIMLDKKWRGEGMDRNYFVVKEGKQENITNHNTGLVNSMKFDPYPLQWVFQIPIAEMDNNPEITENNPNPPA